MVDNNKHEFIAEKTEHHCLPDGTYAMEQNRPEHSLNRVHDDNGSPYESEHPQLHCRLHPNQSINGTGQDSHPGKKKEQQTAVPSVINQTSQNLIGHPQLAKDQGDSEVLDDEHENNEKDDSINNLDHEECRVLENPNELLPEGKGIVFRNSDHDDNLHFLESVPPKKSFAHVDKVEGNIYIQDSCKDSKNAIVTTCHDETGRNTHDVLMHAEDAQRKFETLPIHLPMDDKDEDSTEAEEERRIANIQVEEKKIEDPVVIAQNNLIEKSTPSTELEIALYSALQRKEAHIDRLAGEILKLKSFICKRKQTYKRKRKEDGAPIRPLSAYNIFIQDRFAKLAKDNEKALRSDDADLQLKRVPPAYLVSATGNQWKELSAEEKQKYAERAKKDRARYEEQMSQYQAPERQANRKRNKTGYNMFFSAHVLRLKQTENGVPSERGSVARIVGTAWKVLSAEDKAYYEREADKHNGMHPVKDCEDEEDDDESKRQQLEQQFHLHGATPSDVHVHPGLPPPMHPGIGHPQHDPRHHHYYAHHLYAQPPYNHYDYSQHHQRHQPTRSQGFHAGVRHPYE